jgi:hypothetical protein
MRPTPAEQRVHTSGKKVDSSRSPVLDDTSWYTHKHTYTNIEMRSERPRNSRQRDRQKPDRQPDRPTDRQTYRSETERRHRLTVGQTDTETDSGRDRDDTTGREAQTEGRQTERERERERAREEEEEEEEAEEAWAKTYRMIEAREQLKTRHGQRIVGEQQRKTEGAVAVGAALGKHNAVPYVAVCRAGPGWVCVCVCACVCVCGEREL